MQHLGFIIQNQCQVLGYNLDIPVTMNVYTHISFDEVEEELKKMEEFRRE